MGGDRGRILTLQPEWAFLAAVGLWLWNRGERRDLPATVLTLVLIPVFAVTIAKRGSDLNYALSLRAIGSLARRGAVGRDLERPAGPRLSLALSACAAVVISLLPAGFYHAESQAKVARFVGGKLAGRDGRILFRQHEHLFRVVAHPESRVLTDSGLIDIRHGERALFGDPWLFHMLAETGRLDPSFVRDRVEAEYYDWIITTKDLNDADYASYDFGLPIEIVEAARRHYRSLGYAYDFFFYQPNRAAPTAPGAIP